MHVPFLDLKQQYASIKDEIAPEIQWCLDNAAFILGPKTVAFEQRFAALHNVAHCVGVNSGTSALHLALLAIGVGPGDEVVVPAMTFVATAWAVSYCGATPVFCDVEEATGCMSAASLAAAITPRTKAAIPVHLYGRPCDMDAIMAVCDARDVTVIEDCAQAHCAEYKGRRVGSIGRAGCFSFYPGKNMGAYGEGGAVVTNDPALAHTAAQYRDHAQDGRYNHVAVGYNYRMDGIQGAVLGVKCAHIEAWTEARRAVAAQYRQLLGASIGLPADAPGTRPVYHLFVVRHPERDRLAAALQKEGVATGLHYPTPVHLQKAYAALGYAKGSLPAAEAWADECLSLPIFPELTEAHVAHVVTALRAAL